MSQNNSREFMYSGSINLNFIVVVQFRLCLLSVNFSIVVKSVVMNDNSLFFNRIHGMNLLGPRSMATI